MGVIFNQSFKSTISYYIGMIIGAVNTVILYPLIFNDNPKYLGLIQILLAYSIVLSIFSNLSLPAIIIRYFPVVNKKGQLFFFSLILSIIGFTSFCVLYIYFIKDLIIDDQEIGLILDYSNYIIPLVFFISFSDVLSALSRSYLDSSTPIFLNEVFLKVYSIIVLACYGLNYIQFDTFLKIYFAGYFIRFFLLLGIQLYFKRLFFEFDYSELQIKKMLKFGFFVILGSTTALLISKIDMLMIGSYIDLENVAYYSVAFYIGNAIMVPGRSITAISTPLVAEAWKNNDLKLIRKIYYKSSINQIIVGGLFFLCIWINIDNIMFILPDKFSGGKYIVLFIGLSRLISLGVGVNSSIIIYSKYYKFDLISNIPFLLFIIVSNHLLIPAFGINGAAFATLISTFLFYVIRIIFVIVKFQMHPFNLNTLKTIFLLFAIFLVIENISLDYNVYFDVILRLVIALILFVPLMYKMKMSIDINNIILKFIKKIL